MCARNVDAAGRSAGGTDPADRYPRLVEFSHATSWAVDDRTTAIARAEAALALDELCFLAEAAAAFKTALDRMTVSLLERAGAVRRETFTVAESLQLVELCREWVRRYGTAPR